MASEAQERCNAKHYKCLDEEGAIRNTAPPNLAFVNTSRPRPYAYM